MIAFLNGTVAAVLPPQTAYIDVAGVGYAVAMPGGDLGKLAVGDTARVLTYLSVTENGIALFGFLSEEEKVLFEKLIAPHEPLTDDPRGLPLTLPELGRDRFAEILAKYGE